MTKDRQKIKRQQFLIKNDHKIDNKSRQRCLDPDPDLVFKHFLNPVPVFPEMLDPDPVCPERLDPVSPKRLDPGPDPVNNRPDPKLRPLDKKLKSELSL